MKMHGKSYTQIIFVCMFLSFGVYAQDNDAVSFRLSYSVSDNTVSTHVAITPYDSDSDARNAFLNWFKRGFDTVLAGHAPLMIEWNTTRKARAGQSGYELGISEAERFIRQNLSHQSKHTITIQTLE